MGAWPTCGGSSWRGGSPCIRPHPQTAFLTLLGQPSGGLGTTSGSRCLHFENHPPIPVAPSASNTRRHPPKAQVMHHPSKKLQTIGGSTFRSSNMAGSFMVMRVGSQGSTDHSVQRPAIPHARCSQSSSTAWIRAVWCGHSTPSANRSRWIACCALAGFAHLPRPMAGRVVLPHIR